MTKKSDAPQRFAATEPEMLQSLELVRPPDPPRTMVDDIALPKPRKPAKIKRPKTFSLLMVMLALVGAGTIFVFTIRNLEEHAPRIVQAAMDVDLDRLKDMLRADRLVYIPSADTRDAVLIQINVKPRSAHIFMNEAVVSSNLIRLARSQTPVKFTIWDKGFLPATVTVVPQIDRTIKVRLTPVK